MSKWIGYAVSVNCGSPLGCYQGTILEADGSTITLTKAFRNGFPYPKSQVTLNAADIKELKIIEGKAEPGEKTHSTVAVSKGKKSSRSTVCEDLQANPTNTGNQGNQVVASSSAGNKTPNARPAPPRSKPIDIQQQRNNKNNNHAGSYGTSATTPRGRAAAGATHERARRRNEACFGEAAEPALDDDFDFEGNLALFDKRALWERMRQAKPDLVRHADDKLRPDENVLAGGGAAVGADRVALRPPDELRGPVDYVTDDGYVVASASPALRRALWEGVRRLGLEDSAYTLVARAAADVALRLVGGGRRLDARNAHQAPRVTALCGAHRAGAAGLEAARLLAAAGARVCVVLAGGAAPAGAARAQLAALAADGARLAPAAPAPPPADLVLVALHDPAGTQDDSREGAELAAWAGRGRGAVVVVEPAGGAGGGAGRAAVVALAPPALGAAYGRVFLADVAAPRSLWAELGVTYRAPFGANSVIPLYPADDSA